MTWFARLLFLILVAIAVAGFAYWRFLLPVDIATVAVRTGTAAQIVYATGVVEPRHWAKVATLQRERIVEICDCEGQWVKKGDVLVRLDDSEERANLAEMEARRERLEGDVRRAKSLLDKQAGTQTSYEQVLTQLREYEARIAAQEKRIDDLKLRAPMDGMVLRKDGEVGEIAINTGDEALLWIGLPKPLRIVADVNEDDIPRVQPGQKVLLRNDGFKDRVLHATVAEITPKGDPVNKTFRVYLTLPDDTPLAIGMSVEANIVVEEREGVLVAPAEAVVSGAVFKVEGGRLRRVPVAIGIRGPRLVEVRSGLAAGDIVASPATSALRDGMRVRVQTREAAP